MGSPCWDLGFRLSPLIGAEATHTGKLYLKYKAVSHRFWMQVVQRSPALWGGDHLPEELCSFGKAILGATTKLGPFWPIHSGIEWNSGTGFYLREYSLGNPARFQTASKDWVPPARNCLDHFTRSATLRDPLMKLHQMGVARWGCAGFSLWFHVPRSHFGIFF